MQLSSPADNTEVRSFKAKLVAHFVLLSLVPLLAAGFGFLRAEREQAGRELDRSLAVGLRAATAAYADVLRDAQGRAEAIARREQLARAIAAGDAAAVAIGAAGGPHVTVTGPGLRVGRLPRAAGTRSATIVSGGRPIARVTVGVPLDERLASLLRERSGLESPAGLALVVGGRVVAGIGRGQPEPGTATQAFTVALGDVPFRAVGVKVTTPTRGQIIALAPAGDTSSNVALRELAAALGFALLAIGLIAYFEARSIVRALRRLAAAANEIAGGRLGSRVPISGRDELSSFSEAFNRMAAQLEERIDDLSRAHVQLEASVGRLSSALSSTHDRDHLAQVVVATAVDATGAAGGAFLAGDDVVATHGTLTSENRLEVPVGVEGHSYGTLVLVDVGARSGALGGDPRRLGESLARQAAVAFDNARLHQVLEEQARVDALTGLANRRHGSEQLEEERRRAERSGQPLSAVLCDVDGFKSINDEHGHGTGDEVLRAFARIVRARLRGSDLACRWGGEEFLLVLPDTGAEGAYELAEALRRELASHVVRGAAGAIRVTASFGIALFDGWASSEGLVALADDALYAAKRQGKNAVVLAGAVPTGA
jgi:diguanylate cyclase (GGDEF)-like protein